MIREATEEYTLSSYEPVHIVEPPVQVTEEMIDAQMAREMARFARFEPAPGPACEGECLQAKMEVLIDGNIEESLSGESVTVVLQRGMQPDGFVEGIEGMQIGEQRSFDFLATSSAAGSLGQPADFHVDIQLLDKRKRVIPELTDEFVRERLSATDRTVEQFRERVRNYLANEQRKKAYERRELLAVEELGRRLTNAIPDTLIENTRDEIETSFMEDLTASGLTLAQFLDQQGMSERQYQMTMMMQARESLRQGFALDALYRHLQIPIDDAMRERALSLLAPGHEDEARQLAENQEGKEMVEIMAKRQAACDWLMETAIFE